MRQALPVCMNPYPGLWLSPSPPCPPAGMADVLRQTHGVKIWKTPLNCASLIIYAFFSLKEVTLTAVVLGCSAPLGLLREAPRMCAHLRMEVHPGDSIAGPADQPWGHCAPACRKKNLLAMEDGDPEPFQDENWLQNWQQFRTYAREWLRKDPGLRGAGHVSAKRPGLHPWL